MHGPWLRYGTCRGFEWNVVNFPVRGLAADLDGIRLLHLTDFHIRGKPDAGYEDLVTRVRQNPPDLILFTGDFVDDRFDYRAGLPHVRDLVNRLQSRWDLSASWAITTAICSARRWVM